MLTLRPCFPKQLTPHFRSTYQYLSAWGWCHPLQPESAPALASCLDSPVPSKVPEHRPGRYVTWGEIERSKGQNKPNQLINDINMERMKKAALIANLVLVYTYVIKIHKGCWWKVLHVRTTSRCMSTWTRLNHPALLCITGYSARGPAEASTTSPAGPGLQAAAASSPDPPHLSPSWTSSSRQTDTHTGTKGWHNRCGTQQAEDEQGPWVLCWRN